MSTTNHLFTVKTGAFSDRRLVIPILRVISRAYLCSGVGRGGMAHWVKVTLNCHKKQATTMGGMEQLSLNRHIPTGYADINTRLQLSDASSMPPMQGGFLLIGHSGAGGYLLQPLVWENEFICLWLDFGFLFYSIQGDWVQNKLIRTTWNVFLDMIRYITMLKPCRWRFLSWWW